MLFSQRFAEYEATPDLQIRSVKFGIASYLAMTLRLVYPGKD